MAWIRPHCLPHCAFPQEPAILVLFSVSFSADWPGKCLSSVWLSLGVLASNAQELKGIWGGRGLKKPW